MSEMKKRMEILRVSEEAERQDPHTHTHTTGWISLDGGALLSPDTEGKRRGWGLM